MDKERTMESFSRNRSYCSYIRNLYNRPSLLYGKGDKMVLAERGNKRMGLLQDVNSRHSEDERSSGEESRREEILRPCGAQNDEKMSFHSTARIRICLALAIGFVFFFSSAAVAANSCIECHTALGDEKIVNDFEKDIHAVRGLSCVDCHGGDPNDMEDTAMDPAKGFKGHIERNKIPELCASCHADANYMRRFNPNIQTDQYSKYLVSQHGKLNAKGDQKVAVCISCHGVHGIRPKTDPTAPVFITNAPITCAKCHSNAEYMKEYKIPTDQFEEYEKSVHGQAL